MRLLISYPHLKLYLHEGTCSAIEAQWYGEISSVLLRQTTLECVMLAREHSITGWIADDRQLGLIHPRDLAWIATYVLPLLIKWGVKRFARLEAADPLSQQLIGQAQEQAEQQLDFELRSFTDPAEAQAWASAGQS